MNYWLMKSEPTCYSISDLQQEGETHWDGVRNYQARNMMRDKMKVGDLVFFYHSNTKIPGISGVMSVSSAPYPDFTAQDPTDDHYDPKASEENPRWFMVDVKFVEAFDSVISLQALKNNPSLKEMLILRKGNRLSITPLTKQEWDAVLLMQ